MSLTLVLIATFIGVATLVGGALLLFSGESNQVVEDRLDMLTGSGGSQKTGASAISVLAQPLEAAPGLLDRLLAKSLSLQRYIEQSGLHLSPSKFCALAGVIAGVAMLVTSLFAHWMFVPLAGIGGALIPAVFVMFKRKRRLSAFGRQLPEALELTSRALRAGHSLAAGFSLVAEEMQEPIASEFSRCYEAQNLGIPLEQALDEMTERIPNLDLRFFATAVILQRQTGGDLAEILDKIGHLVRERFKIFGQIQALTGEGRLSGIVLLALPPVLFVVLYRLNPEYCKVLFQDELGQKMLAVAVVMQLLGAYVIRKIIQIKV